MKQRFDLIEYRDCETVKKFMESISPLGPVFGRFARVEYWIFRGHGDSNWGLLPSALRIHEREALFNAARLSSESSTNPDFGFVQCFAEARVLAYFHDYCDQSGCPIPEDSQVIRQVIRECLANCSVWADRQIKSELPPPLSVASPLHEWPPHQLLSLFAIAQHHGVHTRLLDWSQSPYIATYFAAKRALECETDSFAVWALFATKLSDGKYLRRLNDNNFIRLITAPRATNPNLHAQAGIFSLIHGQPLHPADRRPMEEWLSGGKNPVEQYSALLWKITLSSKLAPEVLWSLDKMGVNAATIFPGFGGAALAVNEFELHRPHDGFRPN